MGGPAPSCGQLPQLLAREHDQPPHANLPRPPHGRSPQDAARAYRSSACQVGAAGVGRRKTRRRRPSVAGHTAALIASHSTATWFDRRRDPNPLKTRARSFGRATRSASSKRRAVPDPARAPQSTLSQRSPHSSASTTALRCTRSRAAFEDRQMPGGPWEHGCSRSSA